MCQKTMQTALKATLASLVLLMAPLCYGKGTPKRTKKRIELSELGQEAPAVNIVVKRMPSNFATEEDTVMRPPRRKYWSDKLLVEDNAGILTDMRKTIIDWEKQEEYLRRWDLEKTGVIQVQSEKEKNRFLRKRGLKYIDKRLSGEIKQAQPGSKWEQIGKVHKALKPRTKLNLSKSVRVKFKARVLQGKATMILENPLVDASLEGKVNGQARAVIGKRLKDFGLSAHMEYRLKESEVVTTFRKEITDQISAQATTVNRNDEVNPMNDQRFELNFATSF